MGLKKSYKTEFVFLSLSWCWVQCVSSGEVLFSILGAEVNPVTAISSPLLPLLSLLIVAKTFITLNKQNLLDNKSIYFLVLIQVQIMFE